ncbi:DNA adenine methylase [soil metagenome]
MARLPGTPIRPILKWAGGKRQLLPALRPYYPAAFARYIEPFLGSGAVFLDLWNGGHLAGRPVLLSDVSPDLIGCYRVVRDAVEDVIRALTDLEQGHHAGGKAHFYDVRDSRFNPRRLALLEAGSADTYTPELAAMLIYLNRTGYNGLFRLNSRGAFNVPAGRYGSVRICDADNLRRLSRALAGRGVSLGRRPFEGQLADAGPNDFVYLDPPYAPVSGTASFTSYTAGGFGPAQQETLQQLVVGMALRGVRVLLSNSVAPAIQLLYEDNHAARAAGLRARRIPARRAINSRGTGRGAVLEYVISNVSPGVGAPAGRSPRPGKTRRSRGGRAIRVN